MAARDLTLAVLGGACCSPGKTFLVTRYVTGECPTSSEVHQETEYAKTLATGQKIRIIDTASSLNAMLSLCIQNADGIVLVYSIDDQASFDALTDVHELILTVKHADRKKIMLAANKLDLHDGRARVVTTEEGANLAKRWGCGFVECSAMTNVHVADVFDQLIADVNAVPPAQSASACVTM